MLILTAFWVTFTLTFLERDSDLDANYLDITDMIFDIFFILDIFVNFVSAYYDEKNILITEKKHIYKHYIKGWFIIDALSIIPIFINSVNNLKLFRLLRLPRIYKLQKIIKVTTNS